MNKDVINYLLTNKNLFYGFAILFVILYHSTFPIFYPGFIGVDIFLFFSGYSLCFSYQKHSISNFYSRRFLRIYPMFFIFSSLITFFELLGNSHFYLWDIFCNITTLSYYNLGGCFIDWYLSSLFIFYLLFPFLYKIMTRKGGEVFLCILSIGILILFSQTDLNWKYECAIGRIPIFCLGIIFFNNKNNSKYSFTLIPWFIFSLLLPAVVLYLNKSSYIHTFYLVYLAAPICVLLFSYFLKKYLKNKKLNQGIQYLGIYSLEIYIANCLSMNILSNITFNNRILTFVLYVVFNILFSLLTMCINKNITTLLKKRKLL